MCRPSKTGEIGPGYCKKVTFNESVLEPILPGLQEHWSSVSGNNIIFWQHEWLKHGSCAIESPVFKSELFYFTFSLELNQKYNITTMLNNYGILPNDSKSYKYWEFTDAIFKNLNVTPHIECFKDKVS